MLVRGAGSEQPSESPSSNDWVSGLGIAALWIGLVGYAATLAPNQTPVRDQFFIEWFVGLKSQVTSRCMPKPLCTISQFDRDNFLQGLGRLSACSHLSQLVL